METSRLITHTPSNRKRSHSLTDSADVSLPPPKKISPDPIMSDICCGNLTSEQIFLGIKTRNINSIFNFKKQIAEGSIGTVSFATCCAHNKSFAIKQIKGLECIEVYGSNDILPCLKTIDDTHIMKFYSKYLEPDTLTLYLALEYIEGFNVITAFDQINAMTIDTIHYLMDQFFEITLALGKYNIIHFELFFRNIVYCIRDKTLKAVDFGSAKIGNPLTGISANNIKNIQPFYELGLAIVDKFLDNLVHKVIEYRLDTAQLISWIKSDSEKFKTWVEVPVLFQQEDSPFIRRQKEVAYRILTQNKTRKRLTNESVIEILAWSTILKYIFSHARDYTSHLKHFTLENFLNLKNNLPLSSDESFRELYAASLEIES